MIELEQVGFERGGFRLEAGELVVPEGGYAAVIGPTGSGKTTLLELIAGHLVPSRGTIRIGNKPMLGIPPEGRGVGMVYQRHFLFPHLNVRANLGYGLRGRADRRARVAAISELVEVSALLNRSVETLSGGERQRVALGRALAPAPAVLLLDEPLASLDPAGRRRLRSLLRRIHEAEGTTVVHVTHDFEDALELAAQVAVMVSGRLVQQGRPVEVFRTPSSPFVAEFIGSGNVLAGEVTADDDGVAWFRTEALTLEVVTERRGRCHAMIRPEEILVTRPPLSTPPRNHLVATIERVVTSGPLAKIELDVGLPLLATITTRSADEMALGPGQTVNVAIKATAIQVI